MSETNNYRKYILLGSVIAILIGTSAILGWIFDVSFLKSIIPSAVSMKFNTSLGIILAGLSLAFYVIKERVIYEKASLLFASSLFLLGILTFYQIAAGVNLGIDQLFMEDKEMVIINHPFPGRMSPISSICFCLLGLALLLVRVKSRSIKVFSQTLLYIVIVLSFVSIFGYLLDIEELYSFSFLTPIAIQTAVAFLALSLASTLLNPTLGINGLFTLEGMGNKIVSRLFLQLFAAIALLAYLRIIAHKFVLVSVELGIVLFALTFIFSSLVILWVTANTINKVELEKAKAEDSLNKVRVFLSATPDPIIILDEQGLIRIVNKALEEVFGYPENTVIGKPAKVLLPSIVDSNQLINTDKLEHRNTSEDLVALKASGEVVSVELSINSITIDGKGWTAVAIRDITERKMLLDKLNQSKEQFLAFFNLNPVATIIGRESDGRILHANDGFLSLFGYKKEEVIGRTALEINLVNPDERLRLRQHLAENNMMLKGYEAKLNDRTGKTKRFLLSTERVKLDNEDYMITTVMDLTERIESEEKLKQLSDRLKLATFSSSIGIWEWDVVENVLVWDDVMFRLYGVRKEDFSGAYDAWRSGLYPDDVEQGEKDIQMALSGEKEFDTEFRVLWPDKTIHFIKATAIIQRDENGVPLKMIGTNRDITVQKKADTIRQEGMQLQKERELFEKSTKMREEFLANMSHELRTPLNAISLNLQLIYLMQKDKLDAQLRKNLMTIEKSSTHLLSLINEILDLSKIDSGQIQIEKEQVAVKSTIDSCLEFVASAAGKKGIVIEREIPEEYVAIYTDPKRLKQILINLLSNAVKFTLANGKVGIRTRLNIEKTQLEFIVWDTGIGISQEDKERIFMPFVQVESNLSRSYDGTGLGLSLAKNMAAMLGGSIDLSSRLNVGSEFVLSLPYEQKQVDPVVLADQMKADVLVKLKPTDTFKVLVADDNEVNREELKDYFSLSGYQIIEAVNGIDAVGKSIMHQPDIILMDLQMPVMNGEDAIKELKANQLTMKIPILAVVNQSTALDNGRCIEMGAAGCIVKPFNYSELQLKMNELLR